MMVILSNILAIYRKELQGYFKAPLAYTIAAAFWFLADVFFFVIVDSVITRVAELEQQSQALGQTSAPVDVPYEILQNFLGVMGSLTLVVAVFLSMGLYAEERKQGTLELLATSPITNWAVALGKLLAVLTFFVTLVVPVIVLEAITFSTAQPAFSWATLLISHLGLFLLAAAMLSLGLFISSLTDSMILAAIFTFATILLLWIVDLLGEYFGGTIESVLNHISLLKHFSKFSQGVIDSGSLVLFLSYVGLGLFLTAQSIDLFRFQRS